MVHSPTTIRTAGADHTPHKKDHEHALTQRSSRPRHRSQRWHRNPLRPRSPRPRREQGLRHRPQPPHLGRRAHRAPHPGRHRPRLHPGSRRSGRGRDRADQQRRRDPASAGILTHTDEEIRTNVETNFLGPLFLARAFAPILSAKDESVIIDIHSAPSWYAVGGIYSATKAALWSATNSLRLELAPEGVHVDRRARRLRRHPHGRARHRPKSSPRISCEGVRAVEAGEYEVLADEMTVQLKAALSAPVEALYPELQGTNVRSQA